MKSHYCNAFDATQLEKCTFFPLDFGEEMLQTFFRATNIFYVFAFDYILFISSSSWIGREPLNRSFMNVTARLEENK